MHVCMHVSKCMAHVLRHVDSLKCQLQASTTSVDTVRMADLPELVQEGAQLESPRRVANRGHFFFVMTADAVIGIAATD